MQVQSALAQTYLFAANVYWFVLGWHTLTFLYHRKSGARPHLVISLSSLDPRARSPKAILCSLQSLVFSSQLPQDTQPRSTLHRAYAKSYQPPPSIQLLRFWLPPSTTPPRKPRPPIPKIPVPRLAKASDAARMPLVHRTSPVIIKFDFLTTIRAGWAC
ncbi:hypothetical protein K505DRAFT_321522 [Melanomma pulvis-pyrius CBS 109.77]|uniref:Uncharacterized protein n=1 Tax=Melanomma pulvis-pyrius CBS 109.77 TaxID=1314802 RepID=A0A6A6XR54_9PLEO|nr:hypothetical protein K505DRAFT_321522 [Melanomma pulvis-pyrius CBS 109.77]